MRLSRIVLILVLLVGVIGASVFGAKQPNILFIAVDDMNDWIGPLGGLDIAKTPNLDRLAGESTTFANAHCASPALSLIHI